MSVGVHNVFVLSRIIFALFCAEKVTGTLPAQHLRELSLSGNGRCFIFYPSHWFLHLCLIAITAFLKRQGVKEDPGGGGGGVGGERRRRRLEIELVRAEFSSMLKRAGFAGDFNTP